MEPPPSYSFQPSNHQKTQATLPTAPVLPVAANPSLVPTAPKVLGSISVPITRIQEISQVFHESQESKSINKSLEDLHFDTTFASSSRDATDMAVLRFKLLQ